MVPDFVIAGGPKSGTTALFTYLDGHPRLAGSTRKEPCFWSADVDRPGRVADLPGYEALWAQAPAGALRFEASTDYLRSRVAIPAIRAHNPDARFIAILRNPVDMAHAMHSQLVKTFQEDVGDFERAWRLQPRRRAGEAIPPECPAVEALLYEQVCAIGDHLERLFAEVPAAQRLVLVFDDLRGDPAAAYRAVLCFLGVDDDGRREFGRVNGNVNLRSTRLAKVHRSMPRRLGRAYAPARAAARAVGLSPSALVNRVNVQDGPRPPLRPDFRAELARAFAPQVQKASALLGRDLSHWR